MGETIRGLKMLCRRNIGFAFFLAWNYIALYGCGMAIGSFVPYNLEFIWLVAAASTALVAGVATAGITRGCVFDEARMGKIAAACAIVGNVALWSSYAFKQFFWVLFPIAGVTYGVTIALFTIAWGARLTACNEARIEFDVVACLAIAFALYTMTLPIKLWGTIDLAAECILPCLSAWLVARPFDDPDDAWAKARRAHGVASPFGHHEVEDGHTEDGAQAGGGAQASGSQVGAGRAQACSDQAQAHGTQARGVQTGARSLAAVSSTAPEAPSLTKALIMMGSLWFLVAFLRVVDAPVNAYNRYDRYLIAFSIGFIVTLVLFVVLIHAMRYVDMSMGFRWLLPFAALNVLVLWAGGESLACHKAAYAIVHAGMFGMQMSTWIALAKYLRRTSVAPAPAFAGYALAEGLGIFLGCGSALLAVKLLDERDLFCAILAAMCLVVLVVMMTGFSPDWYFSRTSHQSNRMMRPIETEEEAAAPAVPDKNAAHDEMMRERAEMLRDAFGLTERETEVCALLLGGRSRPFIRDELGISLNTVHAHARNILSKCGVHSQRELIDLEPSTTGGARDKAA